MKKIFFQGIFIVVSFFLIWVALRQIDWMEIFKVEQKTKKTEEKLGELFWEIFSKTEKEYKNSYVNSSIDSIVQRICTENKIAKHQIKVHVLMKDDVNAFALPDGHLVIFSGLILASDNQQELSGVICHEIAHIELNHVMKKLIKEVGLSVLISMTTGNGGSDAIKSTAKMLSSTAFDRKLEKEADLKALQYLIKSNIDPELFANFLYNLSIHENKNIKYLSWISTHPESKERAEYIMKYIKNKSIKDKPVLTIKSWEKLKEVLRN